MTKIEIPLLDKDIASQAAHELFVRHPYPHIPQDALDPWLLFHKHNLLDKIFPVMLAKLPSLKEVRCVIALSYWGFPFGVSLANELIKRFGYPVRCLCLGHDVLEMPRQLSLPIPATLENAILVDDVVHTGGTLLENIKPEGRLLTVNYRAIAVIVILDQDSVQQRNGLEEVLSKQLVKIYAITRTSLVPLHIRWLNSIRALFFKTA